VAIFHLMTHAFFKALLFLAAGSVIIGMHHDQDIRRMGGLWKYMKITWITSLVGSLALIGTPFFAGFYSKDSIIEAVHASHLPGAGFAYFAVVAGVFVTAFYSFRMYFLVFHGKERFGHNHDAHAGDHDDEEVSTDHHHGLAPGAKPHESPWVVTLPLVALMIPSIVIGYLTIQPMLYGGFFGDSIVFQPHHPALKEMAEEFHGAAAMALHALSSLPFWLAFAGVALSWFLYLKRPDLPGRIAKSVAALYKLLDNKYYFDRFNDWFFAGGARKFGSLLSRFGDRALIDGLFVNGSARVVAVSAAIIRFLQTGYLYHYAFAMVLGIFAYMTWRFTRF
jgi:NADH-quinone oxidoreductase subunit L